MNEDKFCTNCGSEIDANDTNCKNCGNKLYKANNEPLSSSEKNSAETNSNNKKSYPDYESRGYKPESKLNIEETKPSENLNQNYKNSYSFDSSNRSSFIKRFFNFDIFITTYILKFLYIAITVLGLLAIPVCFIIALVERDLSYLIFLVILPFAMLYMRVFFELIMATLKLVENTSVIRDRLEK